MVMDVRWTYLGKVAFLDAVSLMENLKRDIRKGAAPEYLLFLQHAPVITRGYSEKGGNAGLVSTREEIEKAGFEIVQTDRGGQTTLHVPGQLVGYTVFDLKRNNLTIKKFVTLIEDVMLAVLNTYGLEGERVKGDPGVYIAGRKIGFIGMNVDRGITTHGFAINVVNDVETFRHIVPCGQSNRPVTNLFTYLGDEASIYDTYWRFVACFEKLTGATLAEVKADLAV